MSPSAPDQAFARFCRTGDPDALGEVYDAVADRLLRTALALAPSASAAEDLVQTTFLTAIERAHSFDRDRPVLPWLHGILANQARLARARSARGPGPAALDADEPPATTPPPPFAAVAHDEFARALDQAIDGLPEAYRPVLLLRLRHQLPTAAIALVLGRPAGTVRAQLSRGIERLRQVLPASFAGLLAGVLTTRGLAAVRDHVVGHAATAMAPPAVISAGLLVAGGFMMKQAVLAVAACAALACLWMFWPADTGSPTVPNLVETSDPPRASARDPELTPGSAGRETLTAPAPTSDPASPPVPAADGDRPTPVPTGGLRVQVRYRKNEQPAAGVTVVLLRGGQWDEWLTSRSDADGVALLQDIPPGHYALRALRGGETQARVRAGRVSQVGLAVPLGIDVTVEVVEGSGAPVAGAAIWLAERWRLNRGAVVGHTDRGGRLELRDTAPDCNLAVRCKGFDPSHLHRIQGQAGGSARLRITLRRGGGVVDGRVVDAEGAPVARARVLVGKEKPSLFHRSADGGWVPEAPPSLARTDQDGRFAVWGVQAGRAEVQVRHADFAPYRGELEVAPGAPISQTIVLVRGARLAGRVSTPDGRPAQGAMVTVGELQDFASTTTHALPDGSFELRGLGAGETRARCWFLRLTAEATLTLAAGGDYEWHPTLSETEAKRAGEPGLVGRVVDHLGQPLAAWRVAAQSELGDKTMSVTTGRDGRFVLPVPWSTMRVWVHPPRRFQDFPVWVRSDVRTDAGELLIRIEEAAHRAATVHGVVVDIAGRPVQAQIQVWHEELRLWRQFSTDPGTGAFRIENLPPGEINLKVCPREHPWRRLAARELAMGQDIDLGQIVVAAAGHIVGQARLGDGRAPTRLQITVADKSGGEAAIVDYADGSYRTGALAAGSYTLRVQGDRVATLEQSIAVAAGQTVTADLNLRSAALRLLEFRLPAGAARPRFLNVQLRDPRGRLAWWNGVGGAGAMQLRASVVPGTYRLTVNGPGRTTWLDAPFVVHSSADLPAPTVLDLVAPK